MYILAAKFQAAVSYTEELFSLNYTYIFNHIFFHSIPYIVL